jgi:peptidylprolyl isomerase
MDSQGRISMKLMKLRKDARAVTSAIFIVLIAVLVVSASSVAVLLYTGGDEVQGQSGNAATKGNVVKVDYIGRLADGRVFDTSLWDVASNDALYPKSLSFTPRSQSAYTPLQFTAGMGQMITGFDQGVMGMVEGQTKVIEVPPQEGYGSMDTSKLFVMPLMVQKTVYDTMNLTEFSSIYGYVPVVGLLVQDPVYGWDVLVMEKDTNADTVMVMNKPTVSHEYAVYGEPDVIPATGWYAQVVSVDSAANSGEGLILVKNLLTDEDSGMVEGYDISKGSTFYVDMVDEAAGTYRMNYNGELLGKTLYFTVTLVDIVNT